MSAVPRFDEPAFRTVVQRSVDQARKVLTLGDEPPSLFEGSFESGFHCVERVANLFFDALQTSWPLPVEKGRTTTLRFELGEHVDEEIVEREAQSSVHATEYASGRKTKSYTVRTEKWSMVDYSAQFSLSAYTGNSPDEAKILMRETVKRTFEVQNRYPNEKLSKKLECNVTMALEKFRIDRNRQPRATPAQCVESRALISFAQEMAAFCKQVHTLILHAERNAMCVWRDNESLEQVDSVFNPCVPVAWHALDDTELLTERLRTLGQKCSAGTSICLPMPLRNLAILMLHLSNMASSVVNSVAYMQRLLFQSLVSVIGKEITANDLTSYMQWHLRTHLQAKSFVYPVRRTLNHDMDGMIELCNANEPVKVVSKSSGEGRPLLHFNISASTRIQCRAKSFLHALILPRFAGSQPQINLKLRARRFCSYLVMLGRVPEKGVFQPEGALMIGSGDDVSIPLECFFVPSAVAFADAIQSLSEEQRTFCELFRSMQLSATLLGVVVVQIKPQLERLLHMPRDSLTKQLQLLWELEFLLVRLQIPCGLVSYDADESALVPEEEDEEDEEAIVAQVRANVTRMLKLVPADTKLIARRPHVVSWSSLMSRLEHERSLLLKEMASNRAPESWVEEEFNVIVLDTGGHTIKSGVAGEEVPSFESVSIIGRPRHMGVMVGMGQKDSYSGGAAPQSSVIGATEGGNGGDGALAPEDSSSTTEPVVAAVEKVPLPSYCNVPAMLNEAFSNSRAVGPVILNMGLEWMRNGDEVLTVDEQRTEKNTAFDYLDALSRSGDLEIVDVEFHVVIAQAHSFEQSVMNTLVQDNIDPIAEMTETASTVKRVVDSVGFE